MQNRVVLTTQKSSAEFRLPQSGFSLGLRARARVNRFAKHHPCDETIDLLLRSQTRLFGCKAIDSNKYTGPACAHKLVPRRGVEKSSTVERIKNVVYLWCPRLRLSSERSARSTVEVVMRVVMYLLNSPSSDLRKQGDPSYTPGSLSGVRN